jgi:hypothetical protein
MFNTDTELLFPYRVISSLRTLRGGAWSQLIEEVTAKASETPECTAFVLMMVRLGGCITCNADSFRAMRGCTQCAHQTVRRLRNSDEELVELYRRTLQEVEKYMQSRFINGLKKRD